MPLVAASSSSFVVRSNVLTRPADTTAYSVGDLVANSTLASAVVPLTFAGVTSKEGYGGVLRIDRVRLRTSSPSLTNAQFRVHFYSATPAPSNGDNGVWLTPVDNYIGASDIGLDRAFANGAEAVGVPLIGPSILAAVPGGLDLYALIEARAAYAPTSAGTFTVILEGYRL